VDGLQFPAIVQWLKQTFSVRFNLRTGRPGHVWGDRYWSKVVEGEPPEGTVEVDWAAVDVAAETGVLPSSTGASPLTAENPAETRFSPQTPARSPPPPGPAHQFGPAPCGNANTATSHMPSSNGDGRGLSNTPTPLGASGAPDLKSSNSPLPSYLPIAFSAHS
jgi:hypothetical protein